MKTITRFWQRPFPLIMAACIQFFLLTLLGMLVYPGGTWTDPATQGYRFFHNFFSDLGLLTAHNGMANSAAALLFFVALCGAGMGLILFFLRFPALFSSNPLPRILSRASSLIGIFAGLSFIGIAFTPADLFITAHTYFVYSAFLSLPAAVFLLTIVILSAPDYPNRYAVIGILFTVALVAYVWLLFFGPGIMTADGMVIQATGQKIIVYMAVLVMLLQAYGAWRFSSRDDHPSRAVL